MVLLPKGKLKISFATQKWLQHVFNTWWWHKNHAEVWNNVEKKYKENNKMKWKQEKNGVKTLQIFLQLDAFFTSSELWTLRLLTQIIFFIQF